MKRSLFYFVLAADLINNEKYKVVLSNLIESLSIMFLLMSAWILAVSKLREVCSHSVSRMKDQKTEYAMNLYSVIFSSWKNRL
jgi:hypothetical protein